MLHSFTNYILQTMPIRKSAQQKQLFRNEVCEELKKAGWVVEVESKKAILQTHNIVVGNIATAKYVLTAHYDTPANMGIPNFISITNMPLYFFYQTLVGILLVAIPIGVQWVLSFWGMPFLASYWVALALFFALMMLLLAGPANRNNKNDNTSGVVTLLEAAFAIPKEDRGKVALVFFDLEEMGKIGSTHFKQKHGILPDKTLINFDCVGVGDTLFFLTGKIGRNEENFNSTLLVAFTPQNGKCAKVRCEVTDYYPSDQQGFARGVGVVATRKNKFLGQYVSRIHTKKDTILQEENIIFLRDGILRLLHKINE